MYKKLLIASVFMSLLTFANAQRAFYDSLYGQLESKNNVGIVNAAYGVYADRCQEDAAREDCVSALNSDDSAFKAAEANEYRVSLFLLNIGFSLKARGSDNENFLGMLAFTAYLRPNYAADVNAVLEKTKSLPEADLADLITSPDKHQNNAVHAAVLYARNNGKMKTFEDTDQEKKTFLKNMVSDFYATDAAKAALCKALTGVNSSGHTPFHIAMGHNNKEAFWQLAGAFNQAGCDKQQFLDVINRPYDKGLSLKDYASKKADGKRNTGNSFYNDVIQGLLSAAKSKEDNAADNQPTETVTPKSEEVATDNVQKIQEAVASSDSSEIKSALPAYLPPFLPIRKITTPQITDLGGNNFLANGRMRPPLIPVKKLVMQKFPLPPSPQSATVENKTVKKQAAPGAVKRAPVKRKVNTAPATQAPAVKKVVKPAPQTASAPVVKKPVPAAKKPVQAKPAPAKVYGEKDVIAAAKKASDKYAYWQILESQGGKSAVAKAQRNLAYQDFDKADKALTATAKAAGVSREKAGEYFAQNISNDYMLAHDKNRIIPRPQVISAIDLAVMAAKPAKAAQNKNADKTPEVRQPAAAADDAKPNPLFTAAPAVAFDPKFGFGTPEKLAREKAIDDSLRADPKTQRIARKMLANRQTQTETRPAPVPVAVHTEQPKTASIVPATAAGTPVPPKRSNTWQSPLEKAYGEKNAAILREKADEVARYYAYGNVTNIYEYRNLNFDYAPDGHNRGPEVTQQKWKAKYERVYKKYIALAKEMNSTDTETARIYFVDLANNYHDRIQAKEVPVYTDADSYQPADSVSRK